MVYEEAEALLQEMLAPLTTEQFFDSVGRACLEAKGGGITRAGTSSETTRKRPC